MIFDLWGTGPNNGLSFYVALTPTMIDFCTVTNGCSFCSFSVHVLFLSFHAVNLVKLSSWKKLSTIFFNERLSGFRSDVEVQGGCNY